MNEKGKEFGLSNTNFVNPHGYHDDNHYSTTYDLATLTREAFKNPLFKEIIKMSTAEIGTEGNEKEQNYLLKIEIYSRFKNKDSYYPAAGVKQVLPMKLDNVL